MFTKDNQPEGRGRPRNAPDKLSVFRKWLAELVPEARDKLAEGIRAGDGRMIELLFRLVIPPLKASFPAIAIDFDQPRAALKVIKSALRDGAITADHADALLSTLERTTRLETSTALIDAKVIESTPLEMT